MTTKPQSPAARALAELSDFNLKMAKGQRLLASIKDEDVQIATADKDVVFRTHRTTLYRYRAVAERTVTTPLLVAYGQVGRYTMTDLQEDRSLLRNLLALGVDVYAVDWGSPTRGDRWLGFDDYVDGFLNDCVEHIADEHGMKSIDLLGICEGGLFSLCYAALYPERVTQPRADDHAGRLPSRPGRGPREPRLPEPVVARRSTRRTSSG